jgi:tRNA 2-selenouridine synthase
MPQISIDDFINLAGSLPVLDVRSPGEYAHAHIPGAYNLPLFTDEERKVVGTLYKQEGREIAIKSGLDYFGPKMRKMVEEVEEIMRVFYSSQDSSTTRFPIPNSQHPNLNSILVHCWRGGMRSAGIAWLLDLYGFKVYTLKGGYKAYRNWVLAQFEKTYPFKIIGGYTGSGKTDVLKQLAKSKHAIIDLEGLAQHKGSAFGALGELKQPGQEQFENLLANELYQSAKILPEGNCIWLEDESRRIGNVNIPPGLWATMRQAPLCFLEIPFEARLDYIVAGYGKYKKEELMSSILRITKRLGSLNAKNAVSYLIEDNLKECFRILLAYYDKFYGKDLDSRKEMKYTITTINCEQVDSIANLKRLIYN